MADDPAPPPEELPSPVLGEPASQPFLAEVVGQPSDAPVLGEPVISAVIANGEQQMPCIPDPSIDQIVAHEQQQQVAVNGDPELPSETQALTPPDDADRVAEQLADVPGNQEMEHQPLEGPQEPISEDRPESTQPSFEVPPVNETPRANGFDPVAQESNLSLQEPTKEEEKEQEKSIGEDDNKSAYVAGSKGGFKNPLIFTGVVLAVVGVTVAYLKKSQ